MLVEKIKLIMLRAFSEHSLTRRICSYLPLAGLALASAWPVFHAGPVGDLDGPSHFFRIVELDWHIRQGDWFPRWLADVHAGFGGPIFNFYGPLSYYVSVFLHIFVPSFPAAYVISFALAAALATVGMYFWANEQFGSPLAGLVGAAAYVFTPDYYHVSLVRGSWPETLALAIVPWLFWAALRLVRKGRQQERILVSLLLAGLLLTHSLSAALFTPILIVYCVVSVWQLPGLSQRQRLAALGRLGFSLATAGLIAAAFISPFLAEASFVQFQKTQVFNYRDNFLSLSMLFALPVQYDSYIVFISPSDSLPWPQLILALIAAGSLLFRKRSPASGLARVLAVNALMLVALAGLTLDSAARLWAAIPFAYILQFPSRLLGPASLLLAWLVAASVAGLPVMSLRRPLALVAIVAIYFYSIPWSYHDSYPYPVNATGLDVARFEVDHPDYYGTTLTQEFVPKWVSQRPDPGALLERYGQTGLPDRLSPLPAGARVLASRSAIASSDLTYTSASPFTATYYQFYFPGWTAVLDGRTVPIRPADGTGLLTVALPAGQHSLHISLEPTLPQRLGTLLSVLGLLLLAAPWGGARREPAGGDLPSDRLKPADESISPVWSVPILGMLALRIFAIDPANTPFKATEFYSIPHPLSADFGGQLSLIGYRYADGPSVASGASLGLSLYWKPTVHMATRYSTSVQLVDAYGNRFGHTDHYSPGGFPTPWWTPGKYARDDHTLTAIAGTPPGTYHLHVSVYSGDSGAPAPLAVIHPDGSTSVDYDLGVVKVTPGAALPPGPLRLLSGTLGVAQVGAGDSLPFTLSWNSGSAALPSLAARLKFMSDSGRVVFSADVPPAGPDFPTERWAPNQFILFPQSLILPADLPAGPVKVSLSLVHPDGTAAFGPFDLGTLTLTVPARTFSLPTMSHQAGHDFNNSIRLLGYDIGVNSITLYWQSLAPVHVPLTVFVHRFGADGAFIAGYDSQPARATTSWLPGEVLTDVKAFLPGDTFEVGLYDPATGARFGEPYRVKP